MLKNKIKLVCLLCIAVTGCKTDQISEDIPIVDIDIQEIQQQAAYHSKGLKFLKEEDIKFKSQRGSLVGPPIDPPVTVFPMVIPREEQVRLVNSVKTYATRNGWGEYAYLANVAFNTDDLPTISLVGTPQLESYEYYDLALNISDVTGDSESEIRLQLSDIYRSAAFKSLATNRQEDLILMGEVLVDSYNYWSVEYWEPELNLQTKRGILGKIWGVVKKDVRGVLAGLGSIAVATVKGGPKAGVAAAGIAAVSSSAKQDKIQNLGPPPPDPTPPKPTTPGWPGGNLVLKDDNKDHLIITGVPNEDGLTQEVYLQVSFSRNRKLALPKSWINVIVPKIR